VVSAITCQMAPRELNAASKYAESHTFNIKNLGTFACGILEAVLRHEMVLMVPGPVKHNLGPIFSLICKKTSR